MNHYQSDKYHLRIAYETRIGGRPENQDALALSETPLGFLAVVCDGMGGGPGGATASTLAAKTIVATLKECTPLMPRQQALKLAVDHAQTALENAMRSNPALQGMGSTLVALLLSKESALIAHLGDSRCYRLSRGRMAFRTKDHSLVGELVQYGSMTEEQARRSPTANVITRGLGATSNHVAQIDEVPYRQGDRFVLCTDGVWGSMPQPQLLAHMMPPKAADDVAIDLPQAVDRLGEQNGNHHDNHTLIVIDTDTQSILKDKMGKREIIFCAVFAVLLVISMVVNGILLSKLAAHRDEAQQREADAKKQIAALANGARISEEQFSTVAKDMLYEVCTQNESLKCCIDSLTHRIDSLTQCIQVLEQGGNEDGSGLESMAEASQVSWQSSVDSVQSILDEMINLDVRCKGDLNKQGAALKSLQKNRAERIGQFLDEANKATDRKHDADIQGWKKTVTECADSSLGYKGVRINVLRKEKHWCVTDDIQKELKRIKKEIADTFKN